MATSRLQPCLERVEWVEGEVDGEACNCTGLERFMVSSRCRAELERRTIRDLVHRDVASGGATSTGNGLESAMHARQRCRELQKESERLAESVPLRKSFWGRLSLSLFTLGVPSDGIECLTTPF